MLRHIMKLNREAIIKLNNGSMAHISLCWNRDEVHIFNRM